MHGSWKQGPFGSKLHWVCWVFANQRMKTTKHLQNFVTIFCAKKFIAKIVWKHQMLLLLMCNH